MSFTEGDSACRYGWRLATGDNAGHGLRVTFISQVGDVPPLETSPAYNVTETVKGTHENIECGGQGYCDYQTGLCQCFHGFVGSDGNGSAGRRRDCGRVDPHGWSLNEWDKF